MEWELQQEQDIWGINECNQKHIKKFSCTQGDFLFGNSKSKEVLHMGKGRSNNAGKKQPNFDDSSNFAKQSQPTEPKKK